MILYMLLTLNLYYLTGFSYFSVRKNPKVAGQSEKLNVPTMKCKIRLQMSRL